MLKDTYQKISCPCSKCEAINHCTERSKELCKPLQRAKAKAKEFQQGCFWCANRNRMYCLGGDFDIQDANTEAELETILNGFDCKGFSRRKIKFLFR